ncbi:hypothetical protein Lalb_Chr17g0343691 [Lupinus albus]|uniref:Uncharacterized protein n=1 Tax=Lupinus albus TaxID=3870 RepID=A0A6A4P040_LUPAL|nr:hypothetical protein Lalb_Chr17g0343691 [Lupinus albus]
MASTKSPFYTVEIEEPSHCTFPQNCPLSECFYVNFSYTHNVHIRNITTPNTTSFNDNFFIPWIVLCDCDDFELMDPDSVPMACLYATFSSSPFSLDLLDSILLHMGEYSRYMIEHNNEGYSILEMNVIVEVNTFMD